MGARIKIQYIRTDELQAYENNPRLNDDAVPFVEASIRDFGMKVPIVVDSNNVIVCGHTRVRACKNLGIEEVPCIVADDLDEDQVNAFRLADNKVSELAGWDFARLDRELECLSGVFDMEDFGFSLEDFDNSISELDTFDPFEGQGTAHSEEEDSGGYIIPPEDDCPSNAVISGDAEFSKCKTEIRKGDIITMGRHILVCADLDDRDAYAGELGRGYDLAMAVIPDTGRRVGDVYKKLSECADTVVLGLDSSVPWIGAAELLESACGDVRGMIHWVNPSAKPLGDDTLVQNIIPMFILDKMEEDICLQRGNWTGLISVSRAGSMLPVQVPAEIIKNIVPENGTVFCSFDPYGSIMVACEDTGRSVFQVENSGGVCQYIVKRYIERTGSEEDVMVVRDGDVVDVKWH